MAAKLIFQEDVSNACNELVKAGEQPSTLKVRMMLGKGSPNTVQKFIKVWRDSEEAQNAKADQLPAVVQLPQEFQEEGELLLKKIFKLAEQEHAAKVEQIQQEREQAVATAQAETAEALDYANGIDEENGELKDQLVEREDKVASLEEEVGRQKASNDELSRINAGVDKELNEALAKVETLAGVVSGLETDKALLEQERDSAKGELVKAQEKHKSDTVTLKDEHREAIKAKLLEHGDEVKAIKADHKEATKELKAAHSASVKDLKTANDKTLKALEAALKDAQKQRDALDSKLADAQANVVRLEKARVSGDGLVQQLETEMKALKQKLSEPEQDESSVEGSED